MTFIWDPRGFLMTDGTVQPPVLASFLVTDAGHQLVANAVLGELVAARRGNGRAQDLGGEAYRLTLAGDDVIFESTYDQFQTTSVPLAHVEWALKALVAWFEVHGSDRPPAVPPAAG
jgi:hypothetical protein